MHHLQKYLLPSCLGLLLFLACTPQSEEKPASGIKPASALFPVFSDTEIAEIYERYLDIKGALFSQDEEMVRKSAEVLHTSSTSNVALTHLAGELSRSQGIARQRLLFAAFSEELIALLKQYPPTHGQVFLFKANEPEPYFWAANEEAANNPYNGRRSHGKLVETLGNAANDH